MASTFGLNAGQVDDVDLPTYPKFARRVGSRNHPGNTDPEQRKSLHDRRTNHPNKTGWIYPV